MAGRRRLVLTDGCVEDLFKTGSSAGNFALFTHPEPHGICERKDDNDEKKKLET